MSGDWYEEHVALGQVLAPGAADRETESDRRDSAFPACGRVATVASRAPSCLGSTRRFDFDGSRLGSDIVVMTWSRADSASSPANVSGRLTSRTGWQVLLSPVGA